MDPYNPNANPNYKYTWPDEWKQFYSNPPAQPGAGYVQDNTDYRGIREAARRERHAARRKAREEAKARDLTE